MGSSPRHIQLGSPRTRPCVHQNRQIPREACLWRQKRDDDVDRGPQPMLSPASSSTIRTRTEPWQGSWWTLIRQPWMGHQPCDPVALCSLLPHRWLRTRESTGQMPGPQPQPWVTEVVRTADEWTGFWGAGCSIFPNSVISMAVFR